MKALLAVVALLVVAVVGVGFWQGWFSIQTTKEDGKAHANLTVDKEKFKQDKDKLKAKAAEKYKALKDKVASLREKSKGLSGEEKAKADKEIEDLSKRHDALEAKMKELDEAGEEKFEGVKQGLAGELDDHEAGTGK